jgi:type II secretory pathway component HofQ
VKNLSGTAYFLGFLIYFLSTPAAAQTPAEQQVDYRDGKISMSFEQFPVEAAINAIRERTGLQIVLPHSSKNQLLSLQLNQSPIEPAVRLLVNSIGFRAFALLYDEKGQPYRAVVLDSQSEDQANESAMSKSADALVQPLTPEERDRLQKQLELWSDLRSDARAKIEERLKSLPASTERDDLVREYGQQILGIKK